MVPAAQAPGSGSDEASLRMRMASLIGVASNWQVQELVRCASAAQITEEDVVAHEKTFADLRGGCGELKQQRQSGEQKRQSEDDAPTVCADPHVCLRGAIQKIEKMALEDIKCATADASTEKEKDEYEALLASAPAECATVDASTEQEKDEHETLLASGSAASGSADTDTQQTAPPQSKQKRQTKRTY